MDNQIFPVEQGRQWLVAQVKPNCYQLAERNLVRQGFRVFSPMQEQTGTRRQKFVRNLRPLFPGYIFVGNEGELTHAHAVDGTSGIVRLVRIGTAPAIIPEPLILELQRRCDEESVLRSPTAFEEGDDVRIRTGPFADLLATIETIDDNRRVWVLLEMLGRVTRVAVSEEVLDRA